MVDFQSRDTKRGLGEDDEQAEQADGDAAEEPASAEQPQAESDAEAEDDHHEGHHADDVESVRVAILTISSTRTEEDDPSGDAIEALVESAGHSITTRDVIRDEYDSVQSAVDALAQRGDVDVIVTTGGTGVSPDDVTIEAVEPLFDKFLPGFGELFRRLSYEDIGTHVVATRAAGGLIDETLTFCLPGSEPAARLGTRDVILEEVGHLVGLAQSDDEETGSLL